MICNQTLLLSLSTPKVIRRSKILPCRAASSSINSIVPVIEYCVEIPVRKDTDCV